jgi:asparagine synthase (glutamine-hydrolysing)
MGVRPLVYHHQPGQHLLFASFPQGIHGSGMVRRELNVDALAHQMLARTQAAETLSRGVLALPPGHTLQVSATGLRLSCYWKPAIQPCRHASPAAAAEELRHLLDRSVRSRVRARCAAKQPVAAHLSGGLDSSAIAVLAARALREQGRRLLAYSFLPNTPDGAPGQAKHDGEWPFVQAVLAQEPQIVWRPILPAPAADRWRGAMQADRVLSLGPDDPENAVCADACAHGAELVLSGWGGDEGATFNGRGALANALLGLRWGYLAQEMRALKRQRGFRTLGILYGDLLTPILPGWALERLENLRGRSGRIRVSLGDVLAPGLRERLQAEGGSAVAISPFVRRNQLSLLSSGHLSQRAANWASIGARYGLAFAFPLLDRRIVDFALALPPQWHLREGWKRRPFRDAMEGILPAPIQWRHTKLTPYPDSPLELVAERARLIGRLDELARHPLVCQVLDLDFVRRLAGSLAKPDIANPAPDSEALLPFVLVSIALQYGCYVEEHF